MDWGRGFKIDKHINHKMRGHGREYMVKIWVLEDKYKKTHFSVDGYEPETNTVYQFHGLHCHGNMCVGNHKKRKKR